MTPMIRQYLQIKERHQDAILFFRLGDFYEMFFEDAEKASKILEIALTSRNRTDESSVPLCGIPYHAATPYIGKLLQAGCKVAVCEQVEDPSTAKGVVQREVVRVITPGTVIDGETLDSRDNNFLVAVSKGGMRFGLALADVTTGEFRFTELADYQSLVEEIWRVRPREVILSEGDAAFQIGSGASSMESTFLSQSPAFLRRPKTVSSCYSSGPARKLRIGNRASARRVRLCPIWSRICLRPSRSWPGWSITGPPGISCSTKRPGTTLSSSVIFKGKGGGPYSGFSTKP